MTRIHTFFRRAVGGILSGVGAVVLTACGGGGDAPAVATAAPTVVTPPTAAAVNPPITVAVTPPTVVVTVPTTATVLNVATVLNLDLNNLFNYVQPLLPTYYNATVAATDNTPPGAVSNAVATLGRVLFYDRRLSVNDSVACASCHQQAQGFGDTRRFSVGFAGNAFTTAHSMRLGNVRYWRPGNMFWDRRAATLEAQASQPIQHPVEMGFDAANGGMTAVLTKLQTLPYYAELFTQAFGSPTPTEARLQTALAQFQRAMVSTNSRWDTGYAQTFNPALNDNGVNTAIPAFTAQENRGRQLFMGNANQGGLNCAACHQPPTFALAANSRSNGLDAGETVLFKSASLKSVAQSGAFMHDGRFSTLEQVVEHYNSGVRDGPALDNRLRGNNNQPRALNLPEADKAALVAFLRTLSDTTLSTDPKFSSPFRP